MSSPQARRRQRSVRLTVAAGLIAIAAVTVIGAVLSDSWLVVAIAAVLSALLGASATLMAHAELMLTRREAARDRAQLAFDDIITAALELGGTVTGEHGVGLLKRDGLASELSPAVMAMHHAVKNALDPHGIMNPGKVI